MKLIEFFLSVLLALPFVVIPFCLGYSDGYAVKTKTINHEIKWPVWVSLGYIALFDFNWIVLVAWLMIFKPCFDYGFTKGVGFTSGIYIGFTEFTDRLIRKLGLYNYKGFSWINIIYFFFIAGGYLLMVHFGTKPLLFELKELGFQYFNIHR